jgi:hypothetical protein
MDVFMCDEEGVFFEVLDLPLFVSWKNDSVDSGIKGS